MPAPDAPTGLTCSIDSEKRPRLAWAATPGATVWQILDVAHPEKLVQATVTVPHSTRSPMRAGQRREYGIRAYGSGGISPMSGTVIVTCDRKGKVTVTPGAAPAPTPAPTPAAPQVPTGLDVVIGQDMRPVLTWDPAAGVDSWDVRDSLNPAVPIQETVSVPRSVRSALHPGSPARAYAVRARNAVGTSLWCLPVLVPAVPDTTPTPTPTPTPAPTPTAPTPAGGRYPADIVGPNWYLTLPTGTAGSPDTIHQPQLATYSSKYFELDPAGDGVVFRVWHGGVTTSGSPNPRSELRECNPDGSLAKWSALTGRHSMTVEGKVNRLTKVRPHVVVAQIHGASNDISVFRVEADKLWVTDGNNNHGYLVDDNFTLGKRYSLRFDVAPNTDSKTGRITYTYNGVEVPYAVTTTDTGNYFKAGNYAQTNPTSAPTEVTTEYDEVVVYSVAVTHAA